MGKPQLYPSCQETTAKSLSSIANCKRWAASAGCCCYLHTHHLIHGMRCIMVCAVSWYALFYGMRCIAQIIRPPTVPVLFKAQGGCKSQNVSIYVINVCVSMS